MPLLTMSFPTKATRRSRAGSSDPSAVAASAAARPKPPAPAPSLASRSVSARSPARAASGSRGANAPTSTPGGPRRVRASSVGSSTAAHRLSAVCREPTSTPRAAAMPSRAWGRNRGCGFTVYSSALPWTFTA